MMVAEQQEGVVHSRSFVLSTGGSQSPTKTPTRPFWKPIHISQNSRTDSPSTHFHCFAEIGILLFVWITALWRRKSLEFNCCKLIDESCLFSRKYCFVEKSKIKVDFGKEIIDSSVEQVSTCRGYGCKVVTLHVRLNVGYLYVYRYPLDNLLKRE